MIAAENKASGKYQPYPEYKDSGVEWLGEVPNHWVLSRVKDMAIVFGGYPFDSRQFSPDIGVPLIRIRDINAEQTAVNFYGFVPKEAIIENDDVLIGMDGEFNVARWRGGQAALNQRVACMRTESDELRKFLFYALPFNLKVVNDLTYYTTVKHLSLEDINKTVFALPKGEELFKIVAYLDHETARIDRLIAKQQQLIELLKEKRQAVISHAVTVKEGEVSAKLSHFVDLLPGYAFPSSGFQSQAEDHIRLLRGVNVGVGSLKWEETVWWPKSERNELKAFELEEGDIVFGMDRPWIAAGARVAEVQKKDLPCLLLQRVARLRTHHNAYQPFVKLCLSSYEFKSFVEADLTGVSVPHISPEQIKCFPIRAIGYDRQKNIAELALSTCKELEVVEARAEEAIKLIQERRTALISAAVTGKIDLRGWEQSDA